MEIKYLNAFNDNYIWLLESKNQIIVIDPGQSSQVINYITAANLNLNTILLTHSHADHIGGVDDLKNLAKFPIYGICEFADTHVSDKEIVSLFSSIATAEVLYTPGHTADGICFLVKYKNQGHLFCGDTLFAAGCGRVFTGDFLAMFNSLAKIKALDKNTLIYPAHEYTLKNLEFAMFIEPENTKVLKRIESEREKLEHTGSTLPTNVALELETNPFLRCDNLDLVNKVSEIVGVKVKPGLDCFIRLRELRNNF